MKTNERLEWVDASDGEVPRGALQGGHNKDGNPLFVARAEHDGNWCCGHVSCSPAPPPSPADPGGRRLL